MTRIQNRITLIFYVGICLALSLILCPKAVFSQANKNGQYNNKQVILSISFDELPNTIQIMGKDLSYSKFSKTLKIDARGITQYQGNNVSFTFSLTLPNYDFNTGQTKTYTNESNHFFDASQDAALMLTIGTVRFGTLYRSKEKENILSKVATTNYQIRTSNTKEKDGNYYILIRINSGSFLQESSETKGSAAEAKLHIAKDPSSHIKIINPQPSLPKVESFKYQSSSEVFKAKGPLK
ncbi:hypothetical protein GCM10027566_35760 [Arachidicoccus ginsenosidivorans]|jgi:hypothetical protein|uniref:Uncharacterized protein n=1 Tax=Arachidicoccus ginsenosidivorans TaxID=496057 RepID=A0A5B8VJL1_9BACT|nr:hypothetical protein [Arachidicoccus ginsenosidivorans]QEC71757.1 hypothetical protein FSB73_08870 [Arachidicoccus ginsenosidivorans]